MPPKCKFTKEQVIHSALELVRTRGIDALTARNLATLLGTSTKPIFGLFDSMQELADHVMTAAYSVYGQYLSAAAEEPSLSPYKASGMGYIRFAKEEPQLFKWLFMRDRSAETIDKSRKVFRPQMDLLQKNLGLDEDSAYRFHLEMWLYVHGIATMLATNHLSWDMDLVSAALTDAYLGLQHQYTSK